MIIGTFILSILSKIWKPLLLISVVAGVYGIGYYKGSSAVKDKIEKVAIEDELERVKESYKIKERDRKTKEEIDTDLEKIRDTGTGDELADRATELLNRNPTKTRRKFPKTYPYSR